METKRPAWEETKMVMPQGRVERLTSLPPARLLLFRHILSGSPQKNCLSAVGRVRVFYCGFVGCTPIDYTPIGKHRQNRQARKKDKKKKALASAVHSEAQKAFSRPGGLRLSRKPKHSRRARCRAFRRCLLRFCGSYTHTVGYHTPIG